MRKYIPSTSLRKLLSDLCGQNDPFRSDDGQFENVLGFINLHLISIRARQHVGGSNSDICPLFSTAALQQCADLKKRIINNYE